MKKKESKYQLYIKALSDNEKRLLASYFKRLEQYILLPQKEKQKMLSDFERAILYYSGTHLPLEEALTRLDPSNLGGFYARPPILWYPLDDAAKIYPLSMNRNQMAIFRLSAYMNEDVIPEILQMALTFTIKRFPYFATTIKKGVFWHYIDSTKKRYSVEPETEIPCKPMNVSISGSQSFRIIYYKSRISVEFFHILTDGTGGTIFLKTLIGEYLRLCGIQIPYVDGVLDINSTPTAAESSNDFSKALPSERSTGFADKPAIQMSGRLAGVRPCQILHFEFNSMKLQAIAKQKGVSVTAFILALMFLAGKAATDETEGSIHIQVPVNMRKFYESNTIRNFSLYCSIRMPLCDINDLDGILPEITKQLSENASKKSMNDMMNATVKLVRILKFIPLFIKRPAARLVYGFLGDKVFSNTLSNLGVIKIPEEMRSYVKKIDFVLGTGITNRASCSMVTLGDTATLSITKMTADPSFENKLYILFKESGLLPDVKGSELYGY